jgi:phosphoglycerate dehydrogenase-like enzyme
MADFPLIVVPGDEPRQVRGSAALERLRAYGEVVVYDTRPTDEAQKIERVRDAAVILNSRGAVRWGAADFARLPKLSMITTCSIGIDAVDVAAAKAHGVTVCNIPERTVPMVAEHLFALMLATSKQAAAQTAEIRAGRWNVHSASSGPVTSAARWRAWPRPSAWRSSPGLSIRRPSAPRRWA